LTKARGNTALQRERTLQNEKKELEEQIKLIERKRRVFKEESDIAHSRASKFRTLNSSEHSQTI
jgi:hypothetical protein